MTTAQWLGFCVVVFGLGAIFENRWWRYHRPYEHSDRVFVESTRFARDPQFIAELKQAMEASRARRVQPTAEDVGQPAEGKRTSDAS